MSLYIAINIFDKALFEEFLQKGGKRGDMNFLKKIAMLKEERFQYDRSHQEALVLLIDEAHIGQDEYGLLTKAILVETQRKAREVKGTYDPDYHPQFDMLINDIDTLLAETDFDNEALGLYWE